MFSKMLIFIFSMIGLFTILFGSVPAQFFQNQPSVTSSIGIDPEVAEYYDVWNITMYEATGADNMTHPYTSLEDGPAPPDWEMQVADQYFEVWWSESYFDAGYGPVWYDLLQIRHVEKGWLGLGWAYHLMNLYYIDEYTRLPSNSFYREHLALVYDEEQNASLIHARCDHSASNIVLQFNSSKYSTIQDAWDAGELTYYCSYEYHWNQTNVNAWTVLGELLTFQSPDLGIPGLAGTIFNATIAFPFWIMVAILIIKLVQSMIPLIKGTEN